MSAWRVSSSQAAAPANSWSMSMPCRAAGSSPTVAVSLVRPPIQSHMGNRFSHPSSSAILSSLLPSPVIATACLEKSNPATSKAALASSIPFRVSLVPPDLDITITSVLFRLFLIFSRSISLPSGSVLSKNTNLSLFVLGFPKAWPTNCGPKADPPMPMRRRFSKFPPSPFILPE